MRMLLLAALLIHSTPLGYSMPDLRAIPTVDISAVRYLECDGPKGPWVGSGFLIDDHVLATALHVAKDTTCVDSATGGKLLLYKEDKEHDLALMTGPTLPTDIPYIKISCQKFSKGLPYMSYGITYYGQDRPITRMNIIWGSGDYTNEEDLVDGNPSPGMAILYGAIAPGMSGGPVVDLLGMAHAVNNAGNPAHTLLYEFADGMLCKL